MLNKKCIVFDLDGTLYFGNQIAKDAPEIIKKCYEKFEHVFFVTNNSAKTRDEIFQKLINMGFELKLEQLMTCGYAIVNYLKQNCHKTVFCIGTESLKKELISENINIAIDNIDAVVIGYNKEFKLDDLNPLVKYKDSGIKLIVANKEHSYPVDNKELLPGIGQIVVAVEYTLNKSFDIRIGKPNSLMVDMLVSKYDIKPEEIVVIGDNYESDIVMAQNYGATGIYITNEKREDCICIKELSELLEVIK